jgi:hypothetical protein
VLGDKLLDYLIVPDQSQSRLFGVLVPQSGAALDVGE